jgi:DnaJ homolog subfamily C member 13
LTVFRQGIFGENKDKQVTGALETIMMKEGEISTIPLVDLEAQFHALRRLLACRVGYCAFTTLPGYEIPLVIWSFL